MPRKKKVVEPVMEAEEKVIETKPVVDDIYYPVPDYKGINFTDALRAIGVPADYANRKTIATKNGVENYLALGAQNKILLEKLLKGELLK